VFGVIGELKVVNLRLLPRDCVELFMKVTEPLPENYGLGFSSLHLDNEDLALP
jgi:hypothetical protein